MGIITNIARGFSNSGQSYSMEDFDKQMRQRISNSHTGVNVNEESALKFITVYSCVKVLAEAIGTLPLVVHKRNRSGGSDKAYDHPLYDLLQTNPNDEMTTVTWREQQIGNQAISGNGYSIITKNNRGNVIDIYPVQWDTVKPFRDSSDGKIKYQVNDRGKYEIFTAEKVFHTLGMSADGIVGYSPIRMAAESIGMGIAAAEFGARFYGQGMNIGGVLEYPTSLSDTAYTRLKEDMDLRGTGLANSHKPLILEEGAKFSRIPMPLSDAQFVESRKFTRDEICGMFRVPPHMIANLERSTNNNIEHQGLEFVKYTLLPYMVSWEKTIDWKLLSPAERRAGYYVKFNVDALLRGDYKSRQEGLAIQRQNGVLNADEWREMEERNPIGGVDGSAYLVNGNMIPTSVAASKTSTKGGEGNS